MKDTWTSDTVHAYNVSSNRMIEDSATDAENYYVSELGIEDNTISSYNHISLIS